MHFLSSSNVASALVSLLGIITLSQKTVHAARGEPSGNQVLFGVWFDPAHGYSDTPTAINQRMGLNVPVFQIAQSIPRPRYNYTTGAGGPAPENLIELSDTDAAVFLTIYPNGGFDTVAAEDFEVLGQQILDYQENLDRVVYLRYAPEMQGYWNRYGFQPVRFVQHWREMHAAVSAIAPETIFVWAPNMPTGYPWGQTRASLESFGLDAAAIDAEMLALDTNGDGVVDRQDDALAPYYPGDGYVDWNGISVYYKGTGNQNTNQIQDPGYCEAIITGRNPSSSSGRVTETEFYDTYCRRKPNLACMFAESGAAWRPEVALTGESQADVQNAWLRDCITNATFLDTFPRMKMLMAFEYEKPEDNNLQVSEMRDFRMTNATEVLSVLREDLALPEVSTRFSWANHRARPTSVSSAGAPPPRTHSDDYDLISATTRARPTSFPSLFASNSEHLLWEMGQIGLLAASGVLGAWTVMRMI